MVAEQDNYLGYILALIIDTGDRLDKSVHVILTMFVRTIRSDGQHKNILTARDRKKANYDPGNNFPGHN
ncbi:hypothetical protein FC50_GL001504 [Lacticaseibacillus pantheris DSM 15945 = JCM 12539 = NBRC 106106]|uniref:Uncharacterized protein n=1 Tax=Lacticaseibacillus pantheris DSM 15945 = JCM 12539 = NBRC 106106 TaxID=1423783 RepID=A0A0R1TWY5_9LACO|nr:hypothetical protein FC50_GL001504 [Lacticaseibacillus pantheris DSM 15945 = JCM 12539 = NBRC 106106]